MFSTTTDLRHVITHDTPVSEYTDYSYSHSEMELNISRHVKESMSHLVIWLIIRGNMLPFQPTQITFLAHQLKADCCSQPCNVRALSALLYNLSLTIRLHQASSGEAAFMTGLERNADIVFAASYAPSFQVRTEQVWHEIWIWSRCRTWEIINGYDTLVSVKM